MDDKKGKTEAYTQTETLRELAKPASPLSAFTGKYVIKPTKKTWLASINPKHDGAVMFSRTFTSLCPERDVTTGLIKTGLTQTQSDMLEIEMNLKKGQLSPYNKEFWQQHIINTNVPADGLEIDCDRSAIDKLRYAYLKVHSKVAQSMADVAENGLYEYVVLSAEKEAVSESKRLTRKKNAFKKLETLTLTEIIDFLTVYEQGKYKVGKNSSPDFINATISKVVDEEPEKFVELLSSPDYKEIVFIRKAISAGLIKGSGTGFYTMGGDKLGSSLSETLFNLKTPEFQDAKISLLAKLEALK